MASQGSDLYQCLLRVDFVEKHALVETMKDDRRKTKSTTNFMSDESWSGETLRKELDQSFSAILASSALNALFLALRIHFTSEMSSSVDLRITAMSINASAARLSALSLRKTKARSRRTCASAIGIAARIPGARRGTVEVRPVVDLAGLSE